MLNNNGALFETHPPLRRHLHVLNSRSRPCPLLGIYYRMYIRKTRVYSSQACDFSLLSIVVVVVILVAS